MTIFQIIAILLTLTAMAAYVNKRFLHLPASSGMMLLTLLLSWTGMAVASLGWIDLSPVRAFMVGIDFSNLFLHGMLSFLLFAGAMHVDLNELKKYRVVVAILATAGVVLATFATGTLVWAVGHALGFTIPYLYALLFGALIAPTDPVAVLSVLRDAHLAKSLRLKISAESLLNDGVSVVLFLILLNLSLHPQQGGGWDLAEIGRLCAWEGVGSIVLGLMLGGAAYGLLHGIDDYKTEILLTLALVAGGYSFAEAIGVSAPITMVIAGLLVGNHGRAFVMSERTRKHLDMFWELIDDILNAILFALIGLQIMVVPFSQSLWALGILAIAATLAGRFISVAIPIHVLRPYIRFEKGAVRLLTWGGLRGGISVAMALSLPANPYKDLLLGMTYLTVVFSVLFQGTTFGPVARKILRKDGGARSISPPISPRISPCPSEKTSL